MSEKKIRFENEYVALLNEMDDADVQGCQPEGVLIEFVAGFVDFARRAHISEPAKYAGHYGYDITIPAINAATHSIEQSILDGEF